MKRIIAAVALSLFCSGLALAAESGQAIVTLSASNGNVSFPHKKHQDAMACTTCHESEKGGKIANLGKDWAHKTCRGCHTEKGKGPTKCGDCHVITK